MKQLRALSLITKKEPFSTLRTFTSNNLTTLWLALTAILFIASLSIFVVHHYHETRSDILKEIDQSLVNAAHSANLMIGDDYHNNLSAITNKQYLEASEKLTKLAETLGVEYLYTMVYEPPLVRFTSSSYIDEDVKKQKMTQFMDVYHDATSLNRSAFLSTEPVFEVSKDSWGHFKSVFVPMVLPNGQVYIAGADIAVSDLEAQLDQSVAEAALIASFFFFIALIVTGFYFLLYRKALTTDARTLFKNRVALERDLAKVKQHHLTLAIVWVKDLEDIISFYGTHIGDEIMQKTMSHFAEYVSRANVYRLATSKIAIVCHQENGEKIVTRILEEFPTNKPICTSPYLHIRFSSGLARGNRALVFENAFVALRQAQQQGLPHCIYGERSAFDLNEQSRNLVLAKTLQTAFEQNRLIPYFVPRYVVSNKQIKQYACLPKILSEQGAILDCQLFQTVLSQSRLNTTLTQSILSLCYEKFKSTDYAWSIKLNYQDISEPQFLDELYKLIRRYPQPDKITFEFPESDVLAHFNDMSTCINSLKSKGTKVAIFAVNSGLLTVSRILKLAIDALHLDEQFTKYSCDDPDLAQFIERITELCHERDIQVLVAGVKSQAQFECLNTMKVDIIEGEYIGKAAPHLLETGAKNLAKQPDTMS